MKKNDDMIDAMFKSIISKLSPEELETLLFSKSMNEQGISITVLDELRPLQDMAVQPSTLLCIKELPAYINLWDTQEQPSQKARYERFKEDCKKKDADTLTADINLFLNSIPYNYHTEDRIIMSTDIWMIASIISTRKLTGCYATFLKTLTYCNEYIEDVLEDDEITSINMFAEICHSMVDELAMIATDENVMPYARGIAICTIAQSVEYLPENESHIVELLTSIFDYYAAKASSRNTAPKLLVKSIAIIAARFQFKSLMPRIEKEYKRLRVGKSGDNNLEYVEAIMNGDHRVTFRKEENITEHLEEFLVFQERMGFDSLIAENGDWNEGDDDWDENEDWDEEDDDDWDEDEDEDEEMFGYNANIKIYPREIAAAHPKGMPSFTDMAYAQFANELVDLIKELRYDHTAEDIKCIALNATLYFEDVLADAGIWRSFVDKMREMYGKPLPFYAVDEEDYYPDEPNLQDVQLLVWMTRNENHEGRIANPENPALKKTAETIFNYMMNYFEIIPVNEQLKKFFTEAKFMKSFTEVRDVLKWAYLSSYLTATRMAYTALKDMAEDQKELFRKEAYYHAESTIIFKERIGPLALHAAEWVAMILNANGKKKEAETVSKITAINGFFHVEKREGNIFTIKTSKGEILTMDRKNFGQKKSIQLSEDYFFCHLASFDGQWYMSGSAFWNNDMSEEYFNECDHFAEIKNIGIPHYDKFLKKSGGAPYICFKTKKEAIKFMKEELDVQNAAYGKIASLGEENDSMTMFVPSEKEGIIYIPAIAECIKAPNNSCFNEKIAREESFVQALNLPYVVFSYFMDNHYLPFAGFNHIKGEEEGIRLFQEDYDFLFRHIEPEAMDKPWE